MKYLKFQNYQLVKEKKILVAVNLMQISEINKKQIKSVCKFISKKKIDIF